MKHLNAKMRAFPATEVRSLRLSLGMGHDLWVPNHARGCPDERSDRTMGGQAETAFASYTVRCGLQLRDRRGLANCAHAV